MAVIPKCYICDKCGKKSDYIPPIFCDNDFDRRLCYSCRMSFISIYDEWCKLPRKKFLGIF